MFTPDLVKACFAISKMRSRLRSASARSLRGAGLARLLGKRFFATGDALRLSYPTETLSVLSAALYAVNADAGVFGKQEEEDGKRI